MIAELLGFKLHPDLTGMEQAAQAGQKKAFVDQVDCTLAKAAKSGHLAGKVVGIPGPGEGQADFQVVTLKAAKWKLQNDPSISIEDAIRFGQKVAGAQNKALYGR